jgi:hypothetical protein
MDELVELQAFVLEQTRTKAMDARTSEALTKGIRNQQIMIEKRDLQREIQELRKELADAKRKALRVG